MNSLSTSVPAQGHQLCIDLPLNVPVPQFQLFQKVRYKKRVATIVGIEYIDPITALSESLKRFGWSYLINDMYGASVEEVIGASFVDLEIVEESRLQPLEEGE